MSVSASAPLPDWAHEMVAAYSSDAANQFILYGNVGDRMLVSRDGQTVLDDISGFLRAALVGNFDVVFSYDLGNGLRVEKGGGHLADWPAFKDAGSILPRAPKAAVEMLTHYFRYLSNLQGLGATDGRTLQVACIIRGAHLITPAMPGGLNYDLNAMAMLIRDWSVEAVFTRIPLATFLLTDAIHDLHPILANNSRAASFKITLPEPETITRYLASLGDHEVLADFAGQTDHLGTQLAGLSLGAIDGLVKLTAYKKQRLTPESLSKLKKSLVEKECGGLIDFIDSPRTLDDLHGQDAVKAWLRQDIALWRKGETAALPMGYLLCGPVGTGKTYLVECLAGEAGVPVVKLNNFRDKWQGTTEGNLEKIFRLLAALGKCFVFIDEADQALGKRDSGSSDAGLSGRIYSMFAQEMSNSANRGKLLWILASSRPDLIEVDLKRPGRVDVKIPIFPTATPEEGFHLIRALCRRRGVELPEDRFADLRALIPDLLTPGAAEALSVRVFRALKTGNTTDAGAVLATVLADYQPPVAREVMDFQIGLAAREATDLEFVPEKFRHFADARA